MDRCVEWIGKRSRRKIGRAIDFFPLTGNKPPSQTVAPLCFEASVNLPGFLAAAVIRNLARINRSYKSLFLSRFPRTWGVVGRRGNTVERAQEMFPSSGIGSKRAITLLLRARKLAADERTWPVYIYIYMCVCVCTMTFVIRNNKGSDRFLADLLDINDSTYRSTARHSTDFFDYFS